jgi:hypothetical protein
VRAFWTFLQRFRNPVFTGRELKNAVGDELAHILWRERIAAPTSGGDLERRDSQCNDDVVLHFSIAHLVELLRRHLQIDAPLAPMPGFGASKEVLAVGTLTVDGDTTSVFLVVQPVSEAFLWFLQLRRLTPGKTMILVPTAEGLPSQLLHLYQAGGLVQLRFLDETLCVRHGQIVAATRRAATAPGPFCHVCDQDGVRLIARPEYHTIKAAAEELELLIDSTTTCAGGLYRASASLDGVPWIADIPWSYAAVLTELGVARRPMRVDELTSIQVDHRDKLIERARSLVDVELTWRAWRAFKTLPADSRADKRYFFDPPVGFRFAFLYL